MSQWLDSQKKPISSIHQLLQERIEKANPRRELTVEETKRIYKLEGIADKLKRGENVQNLQLQTWSSEEEYEQIEYEWREQLELRNELKDKPSDLKRYQEKLKQATFNYNRAEGCSSKGKHSTARNSTTRVKAFVKMRQRCCKKFCTMTAIFVFGLIKILALKQVVT